MSVCCGGQVSGCQSEMASTRSSRALRYVCRPIDMTSAIHRNGAGRTNVSKYAIPVIVVLLASLCIVNAFGAILALQQSPVGIEGSERTTGALLPETDSAGRSAPTDTVGHPEIDGIPILLLLLPLGGVADDWVPLAAIVTEVLLAGVTLGMVGLWISERDATSRIRALGAGVETLRTNGLRSTRLPVTGNDKISGLAGEINLMLDRLEHSQHELEESRDRYQLLFNSGNDFLLVCAIGNEGTPYRILDANALTCQHLGYSREELKIIAPQSVIEMRSDFAREGYRFHTADLITKEGDRVPVEVSTHRIRLGGTAAVLAIARDTTERRRTEKELMEYRYRLEELVTQRTNELRMANEHLRKEINERKEIERQRMEAYWQIEKNIEQFAVLTDHIRHPLQVIRAMADLIEDDRTDKIIEQVDRTKAILKQLDEGWIESEKIREYLKRHPLS
jgi:PAS domain S-box-containing protein